MVWGAVIMAGTMVAGSLMQSAAQRSAANQANSENERIAKEQLKRDKEAWEISYLTQQSNYAWEIASTEAMRYQDRVAEADYNAQQSRVIDSALINLELNQQALLDQYGIGEELRATQENLTFDNEIAKQRLSYGNALIEIGQLGQQAELRRDTLVTSADFDIADQRLDLDRSSIDILNAIDNREAQRLRADNAREDRRLGLDQTRDAFGLGRQAEIDKFLVGRDDARTDMAFARDVYRRGRLDARLDRNLEMYDIQLDKRLKSAEVNQEFLGRQAALNIRAAESNAASIQSTAELMNSIKQRGQQADQLVANKSNEGADIQEQLLISEQLDTMRRDAEYITAISEGADTKARTVSRGGGSNSARRVALESMQAYGRKYGELQMLQQDKRRALTNYNADLVGNTASRLAEIATVIQGEARKIEYTQTSNNLKNAGFTNEMAILQAGKDLSLLSIGSQAKLRRMDVNNKTKQTIEGLRLEKAQAKNRYDSTLANLKLSRNANIDSLRFTRDSNIEEIKLKASQQLEDARLKMNASKLAIADARLDQKTTKGNIKELRSNRRDALKEYRITASGLKSQIKSANQEYGINSRFLLDNFNQLTVPGFELARRQGEREYAALVNNTYNEVEAAATPYRKAIIFDPLEPIAGLQPKKGLYTKLEGPSMGQTIGRAFISGVQGAMSQSYTNQQGNLAFR